VDSEPRSYLWADSDLVAGGVRVIASASASGSASDTASGSLCLTRRLPQCHCGTARLTQSGSATGTQDERAHAGTYTHTLEAMVVNLPTGTDIHCQCSATGCQCLAKTELALAESRRRHRRPLNVKAPTRGRRSPEAPRQAGTKSSRFTIHALA